MLVFEYGQRYAFRYNKADNPAGIFRFHHRLQGLSLRNNRFCLNQSVEYVHGVNRISKKQKETGFFRKKTNFAHNKPINKLNMYTVLDKLKLNVRSLIASMEENSKDLLDLCIDVIYHNNMKAFGLHQLILLYIKWEKEKEEKETAEGEESNG